MSLRALRICPFRFEVNEFGTECWATGEALQELPTPQICGQWLKTTPMIFNGVAGILKSGSEPISIISTELNVPGKFYQKSPGRVAIGEPFLQIAHAYANMILHDTKTYIHPQTFTHTQVQAAGVILLANPDVIMATNARRKAIQYSLSGSVSRYHPIDDDSEGKEYKLGAKPVLPRILTGLEDWRITLESELTFVRRLLTSYLPQHHKSPNLWGYYRWLMGLWVNRAPSRFALKDVVLSELRDVVLYAVALHPDENYHAVSKNRQLPGLS